MGIVQVQGKRNGDALTVTQKQVRWVSFVCSDFAFLPFPRVQKLDDLVEVVMTSFTRVSTRLTAFGAVGSETHPSHVGVGGET